MVLSCSGSSGNDHLLRLTTTVLLRRPLLRLASTTLYDHSPTDSLRQHGITTCLEALLRQGFRALLQLQNNIAQKNLRKTDAAIYLVARPPTPRFSVTHCAGGLRCCNHTYDRPLDLVGR